MDIDSVIAATSPAIEKTKTKENGSSTLGKDEFLRLLVAQLSNQDPLNPMDGQEFAAQLAQFSSVEQLININETLGIQGSMQQLLAQSISNSSAAGLIGKMIEAEGSKVAVGAEGDVPIRFELADAASEVKITIEDGAGTVVRTIDLQNLGKGEQSFTWDGMKSTGGRVPSGNYVIKITATGTDGKSIDATTIARGRVDRVSFGQDGATLWIGDVSVPLSSVRSVSDFE
jgi:flagellar basal-body rod modification protein FlgD